MNYVFRRLPSQRASVPVSAATRRLQRHRSSTLGEVTTRPWGVLSMELLKPQDNCSHRWLSYSRGLRDKSDDRFKSQAKALNQKALDEQEQEVRLRQHQIQRPWHRDGADEPPVRPSGEANGGSEPLSKGKLLTTPTHLLKLILPLPVSVEKDRANNSRSNRSGGIDDKNDSGKDFGRSISQNDDIQPLALLIHPQQPLSYVERLIQAELPPVIEDGKEKIPNIYFRAEDNGDDEDHTGGAGKSRDQDGGKERGRGSSSSNVASYSGLGHEASQRSDSDKRWVRWSSSTEVGDFIRDAARGREFVVEVEGYGLSLSVGVPSFNDRTHYLRSRLRRMSRSIERLASIKRECDVLAHRGAHRLAQGGFGLLAGWWGVVYYVTFHTEAGWDLVEPVTYLAGLATIMAGYLWFLYISRDVSYKAAMQMTISRRQATLYEARGFDVARWEQLAREANALRAEIRTVAQEYDVEWDEAKDLGGEEVKKVLEKERQKRGGRRLEAEEEEEEEREEKEERREGHEGGRDGEKDAGDKKG